MERLFPCLLAAVLLLGTVRAQTPESIPGHMDVQRNVRRIELEVALGPTFGYASLPGQTNMHVGLCGGLELRYNLRSIPLDVGLQSMGSFYWRESPATCLSKFYNSGRMMGVADYNLSLSRRVECFFGAGAGWLAVGHTADMPQDGASDWSFRFGAMPRAGVECWHHLRLTFGYVWTERANSHCLLTIGVVFGGGSRLKGGF